MKRDPAFEQHARNLLRGDPAAVEADAANAATVNAWADADPNARNAEDPDTKRREGVRKILTDYYDALWRVKSRYHPTARNMTNHVRVIGPDDMVIKLHAVDAREAIASGNYRLADDEQ